MLVAANNEPLDSAASEKPIAVLALDIDGVITDGTVFVAENDNESQPKRISMRDLDAMAKLRRSGVRLALVTGEEGPLVTAIAKRVHADLVISGAKDKVSGLERLRDKLGISLRSVCFVGDAERDSLAFPKVALSLAPRDAGPHARQAASQVLNELGGHGAVSEAVEMILAMNERPSTEKAIGRVQNSIEASVLAHQRLAEDGAQTIVKMAQVISLTLKRGGKVLFCGNGGSAADAQHAAAELMGRFLVDRAPLSALSLTTDTSVLTAVGNDWKYEDVFARQVQGLARPGDVVVGMSTSGRSENVVRALTAAREIGAHALSLTGADGRQVAAASDQFLAVPTDDTPRIQELHILALHSICDIVEQEIFCSSASDR